MSENIGEYDWLIDYTRPESSDVKLHAPNLLMVVHYEQWWDEGENYGEVYGPAPALCGESGEWSIPGVGSRMCVPRCERCCELSGFPAGVGSPKNDQTCRELLGMRSFVDRGLERRQG